MIVYRRQEGGVVTEFAVVTQQLTTNVVSTATIAQEERPAETAALSPEDTEEVPQPSSPASATVVPSSAPDITLASDAIESFPPISAPEIMPQPTDRVDAASVSGNASNSLSPGLISAIVIAALLVCMAVLGVAFSLYRRKQRKEQGAHARDISDARSTIMWDNPPRPMMRGGSLGFKPKHFAPPSHTFMQSQSHSNDPYRDSSANVVEMPTYSAGSSVPSPYGVAGASSPFADPVTPTSPKGHKENRSAEDDGAIRNPFADPKRRSSYYDGPSGAGVAL